MYAIVAVMGMIIGSFIGQFMDGAISWQGNTITIQHVQRRPAEPAEQSSRMDFTGAILLKSCDKETRIYRLRDGRVVSNKDYLVENPETVCAK